jgi:hypothetical protein
MRSAAVGMHHYSPPRRQPIWQGRRCCTTCCHTHAPVGRATAWVRQRGWRRQWACASTHHLDTSTLGKAGVRVLLDVIPALRPANARAPAYCYLACRRVRGSVVGRARTSRRVPLAGLRCAVSPGPRPKLFRPVSRPMCGFGVSGSASLCVA